jgi:hypothetical protein
MRTIKTYRKVGAFYIACEEDFATSLTKSASSRVFLFLSHTHLLPHMLACFLASDALRFSNSCLRPTYELGSCHFIDSVLPTRHLSDHVRP